MEGTWASTIRYRDGTFYLITSYIQWNDWAPKILLFTTENPFEDNWSDPVVIENPANDIDPDIFWDDDGKVYMAVAAGIWISEINIKTGVATEPFKVWNGTGDRNPEGPHLYKKDGYYYLLIGEGGTELNHTATLARSKHIRGPYKGYPGNPFLTNKNTDEYFQTVGHADLFQDASGNWWAVALATRSGPAWEIYPMGRETVLVPMKWEKGEWPVIDQVRGKQSGPLPPMNRHVKGNGPFADEGDELNFAPGSSIPMQLLFWRPPKASLFAISPPGHPDSLRISPSRVNLTADELYKPAEDGLGFIARKQTATTFNYSVDLSFRPTQPDEEAGVTVFLTQMQHIDLSVINLDTNGSLAPHLRWRVEAVGKPNYTALEANIVPLPMSWRAQPIRLSIEAKEDSQYSFAAAPVAKPREVVKMGTASAGVVSGGSGPFTGKWTPHSARSISSDDPPCRYNHWCFCNEQQRNRLYPSVLQSMALRSEEASDSGKRLHSSIGTSVR